MFFLFLHENIMLCWGASDEYPQLTVNSPSLKLQGTRIFGLKYK